jgi:cytochrome c oxidase subunit 2
MIPAFQLFPDAASGMAREVDRLLFYLLAISGFFTLLILTLIVWFALRYRRRTSDEVPPPTAPGLRLEIAWTIIPLLIAITMFAWGADVYVRMFDPPANAMEVYVIGKQWMWHIQHPEGRREINELHVPVNRPIKLVMASQDVIHSFFMPAFRIKHDVVPGRYNLLWFQPDRLGTYDFFCTQYCGSGHSQMIGHVIVMEQAAYEAWLAGTGRAESPAAAGGRLFGTLGCATCHGQQAPTLAGLYNRPVALADGRTVTADVNYLRESILDSTAKIVAGYQPIMPSYRGQISEEQLVSLIEYIKSLPETGPASRSSP